MAHSLTELAGPARKTFIHLISEWSLSLSESARILGMDERSLTNWLESDKPNLSPEAVDRISHMIAIHKALETLLPLPGRPAAWLRASNRASTFCGGSAIDVMAGSFGGLVATRQYLEAQLF